MTQASDKAALADRIVNHLEFLGGAFELYGGDRIQLTSQMHQAMSRQHGSSMADALKILGGLVRRLAARAVLDAALDLEVMAENDEFGGSEEIIASLEVATQQLKAAMQEMTCRGIGSSDGISRPRARSPATKYPIRVVTIDGHEITRSGIRFILLTFDDIELVGEAHNGAEGLRLCTELRPDVVLMDVGMQTADRLATTRAIKRQHSEAQVLVLTARYCNTLVIRAMQAGAIGYVIEDASSDELGRAIRAAGAGRTIKPIQLEADPVELSGPGLEPIGANLTTRQREILSLLVKGMPNIRIAELLSRSQYTIRHHVSELIAKLGAHNRAEAAAIAVKHGLVD